MIRYVVIITGGDKLGESYFINEDKIDEVIKNGFRIYESNVGPNGAQVYYPCRIVKREYKLINETEVGTTLNSQVKTKYCDDDDYDWKDHWC